MIRSKFILKYVLGILFFIAGIGHFVKPEIYLQIMPPYLPFPILLIYISGFCESIFGLMLCFHKTSRIASWLIIALLIAIFPANIHMALHPEIFPQIPQIVLWIRLPFQGLLISWAYCYTKN